MDFAPILSSIHRNGPGALPCLCRLEPRGTPSNPLRFLGHAGFIGDSQADAAVSALARISEKANAALMRGDVATYRALVPRTQDFTLMSPFGGTPSREADITEKTWDDMSRFFRNGTLKQEIVQTYVGTDMIVLAVIERAHVEVGGLPAQDWALRVTLVYRRAGRQWLLAHRHADPLGHAVTLQQSAALARGV
ncbi:NTF2 domain-containing protein (plasmid) [Rhizobium etli 8C-3]|uniref:NTF2 domain-containing protein n=1 Tax=Rhizobium etli 8C-3 TaxID=538025 RepID=A0A1L5PH66_RHIET|nr:nuclear transport factor 2 family protein [Rhizobium etli]APO79587.1 NTF2 domain-containing protein [Rhizobium etli 8C-3]